ncbi:MAG TPA: hypothetical protein VNJ53_00050 [Gaiellaceae bacterium]|nr:hypothetical protein [Gaiellaceae bacterium]
MTLEEAPAELHAARPAARLREKGRREGADEAAAAASRRCPSSGEAVGLSPHAPG